jgi:hypothetical protein
VAQDILPILGDGYGRAAGFNLERSYRLLAHVKLRKLGRGEEMGSNICIARGIVRSSERDSRRYGRPRGRRVSHRTSKFLLTVVLLSTSLTPHKTSTAIETDPIEDSYMDPYQASKPDSG